jgi:type IV secretion system protein VirD4
MARKNRVTGPQQNLPGVEEALAYRNANMDLLVLTGLSAVVGSFLGGTVSAYMLGGAPWFFGEPFLPASQVGFNMYSLLPDLVALVKYKEYPVVQHAAWVGVGIFLSLTIVGWIVGARKARKARDKLLRSEAYGSAHWATKDEMIEAGLLPKE